MAQDYKKAQIQGTASTGTYATLYTTPAGKQALISTILVCNTDVNNPVTVRVGFDDTAGTPDTAQGEWLVYDAVVAAGDTLTLSLGISMDQEKFLRVSSSNTNANFTAFVVEIGASGNSILPAFCATQSQTSNDVTGDGTDYIMTWNTERFDQGGDFDGTSTFTAPVTGRYLFTASVMAKEFDSSVFYADFKITTSNHIYIAQKRIVAGSWPAFQSFQVTALADMDSADTCVVTLNIGGGTKTVDINGSTNINYFSGYLVA